MLGHSFPTRRSSDLVQEQFRIAAGEPLRFKQSDIVFRGHAVECRINAEIPEQGFRPNAGLIQTWAPPIGPNIRLDTHCYPGYTVPVFYDSMLAKLIVHAPNRELAVARMHRALLELTIDGVETSRGFHLRVMEHPEFQRGDISIQWLEQNLAELTGAKPTPEALQVAAIAAALVADAERSTPRATQGNATASNAGVVAATSHNDAWRRSALREGLRH